MDWTDTPKAAKLNALQGDIYDEEAGESVQANSYTQPYSQIVDSNALLSGGNIMGRWQKTISDSNDIQVQAYYDRTNRGEANLKDFATPSISTSCSAEVTWARQKVTWGLIRVVDPVQDTELGMWGFPVSTFVPDSRTDYLVDRLPAG